MMIKICDISAFLNGCWNSYLDNKANCAHFFTATHDRMRLLIDIAHQNIVHSSINCEWPCCSHACKVICHTVYHQIL